MSNIRPIAKIWIKMYNFKTFLPIYIMNRMYDFCHVLCVTHFFTHKHLEMVKNDCMCTSILSARQNFCDFFFKKNIKNIFKNKKLCKCPLRHGAKLSSSSRSYIYQIYTNFERASKSNFWHNSHVNRRSFGKVMELCLFQNIHQEYFENMI